MSMGCLRHFLTLTYVFKVPFLRTCQFHGFQEHRTIGSGVSYGFWHRGQGRLCRTSFWALLALRVKGKGLLTHWELLFHILTYFYNELSWIKMFV